jgi:hypothetical protein
MEPEILQSASMRELYIDSTSFAYGQLDNVLRLCPNLTTLSLVRSVDYIETNTLPIAACCPLLEKLVLNRAPYDITSELLNIAEKCPNLREFEILDYSFHFEERLCEMVKRCPLLVKFRAYDECFGDKLLTTIVQYCPRIQVLCFDGSLVTDEVLRTVLRAYPALKEISARKCDNLTAKSRTAIRRRFPGKQHKPWSGVSS